MKYLHSLCIFMLALASISYATLIEVSGDVSGVWDADTVLVTGEVQVPDGDSLMISPGVEVLFTGDFKLIVADAALLQAIGTETDSIRFDWYYPDTYWHGIRFLSSSDSSRLEYCIIKHGFASGVDDDGGGIQIDNCSPSIMHCTIDSCKADDDGGGVWVYNSSSTFSYCSITNNEPEGMDFNYSSPTLQGNIISGNSGSMGGGIRFHGCSGFVFSGNAVTGNQASYGWGGGLSFWNSSGLVHQNEISNNFTADGGGGLYCEGSGTLEITNNDIYSNHSEDDGGGIYLLGSASLISGNQIMLNVTTGSGGGILCLGGVNNHCIQNNLISHNQAVGLTSRGGGIYLGTSGNLVSNNIISNNSAGRGGGIYCYDFHSNNTITLNQIYFNEAFYQGGGIYGAGLLNEISYNTITYNEAQFSSGSGGGIYIIGHDYRVFSNIINENAARDGGGVYLYGCLNTSFYNNDLAHNICSGDGGGLYLNDIIVDFRDNNIRGNSASYGGAIYANASTANLTNHIIWQNSPSHFYGSNFTVTYSDVSGGYTGQGNFYRDPMFIAPLQPDGHLLWGSPCIDNGNPALTDPDSTVSDVGTHFYDQLRPVRIIAIPYDAPIQVPSEGGELTFLLALSNCAQSPLNTTIWCDITLPGGTVTSPVIGPLQITPGGDSNILRVRTQTIPFNAPTGIYSYNAYAVCGVDTSTSNFIFVKLGQDSLGTVTGWQNSGESFDEISTSTGEACLAPKTTALLGAYPNPFNPTTTISFQLSEASHVKLDVFDVNGRRVGVGLAPTRLFTPGEHHITFDASGLASGLYLYRLQAGDYTANGKMILMK